MDFEKLYKAYYMDVFSYVITLVKDKSLAEEMTQDVFLRAMKSKKKFEGRAAERTWLCAIAKNACMDELRRHSKMVPLEEELPCEDNFTEHTEDKELLLQIHKVLHQMDEPYKEVFQLRVFGELSFADIAAIFGKTESWARVTFHRSRLKIRERLNENG